MKNTLLAEAFAIFGFIITFSTDLTHIWAGQIYCKLNSVQWISHVAQVYITGGTVDTFSNICRRNNLICISHYLLKYEISMIVKYGDIGIRILLVDK